jgi:hypothetical protein
MTRTTLLPALAVLLYLATPVLGQEKTAPSEPEQKVRVEKQGRVQLGGISIGAGYSRYGYRSPGFYYPYVPYYHGDYYHPLDAWAHPGYHLGFDKSDSTGRIKLKTEHKEASVFLDGAFAGVAKDLREIWLEPGVYQLKVATERHEPFELRVYVLTGKTIKIEADLKEREKECRP